MDRDGSAAHAWFHHVLDNPDTQVEFANRKHAIPARRDLAGQLGSEYLNESYDRFTECQLPESDCRLLLAESGLSPAPSVDACMDRLGSRHRASRRRRAG